MGSRAALALALACLVLAGCSTIPGASAPETDRQTLTPVPVTEPPTTAAPTPLPVDPPPGIAPDGAVNVTRLAAAHEAYVANRTYRWFFRYGLSSNGTGSPTWNVTRRAVVGADGILVEQATPGLAINRTVYVSGDEGFLRTDVGNETTYRTLRPRDHRSYAYADEVIRQYLEDVTFDLSVVRRGGRTYYRLHTRDGAPPESVREGGTEVWNYTATAYVTPEGFVRTVVVEYDRVRQGQIQHVSVSYHYFGVGSTSLPRPEWVTRVTATPGPGNATNGTTATPSPTATGTGTPNGSGSPNGSESPGDAGTDTAEPTPFAAPTPTAAPTPAVTRAPRPSSWPGDPS